MSGTVFDSDTRGIKNLGIDSQIVLSWVKTQHIGPVTAMERCVLGRGRVDSALANLVRHGAPFDDTAMW